MILQRCAPVRGFQKSRGKGSLRRPDPDTDGGRRRKGVALHMIYMERILPEGIAAPQFFVGRIPPVINRAQMGAQVGLIFHVKRFSFRKH